MDERQQNEALKNRSRHSRQTRGQFGGGNAPNIIDLSPLGREIVWFKVQSEQKNEIDIVPFVIATDWYSRLRARSGGTMADLNLVQGAIDYKLEVPVHQRVGPSNANHFCPYDAFGQPCPICEEKFALLEANGNKWNRDTMGPLNASWRCFYNIYDYKDPNAGFKPWEVAYKSFEEILQDALDIQEKQQQKELFPWALDGGNTLEFHGRLKKIGANDYIEPQIPEFFSRNIYERSVLDETIAFDQYLVFSTYDQIAADHFGMEQVATSATGVADPPLPDPGTRRRTPVTSADDTPATDNRRQRPTPDSDSIQKGNECPSGHDFGYDTNKFDDCNSCADQFFDKCIAAQDEIQAQGSAPEPEQSKQPERSRPEATSRRRSDTKDTPQTSSPRRRRT